MTYFKRYLTHELKTTTFRTSVLTAISVIICNIIAAEEIRNTRGRPISLDHYNHSGIYVISYLTILASILLPILETYSFKSRRSNDLLFSLPITRKGIAVCHYIVGLIQLIAITAITTLTLTVHLIISGNTYNLWWIIPFYFVTFLLGICIYSVVIFLFSQGNTVGDGIAFTFGFPLAVAMFLLVIDTTIAKYDYLGYVFSQKDISFAAVIFLIFDLFQLVLDFFSERVELVSYTVDIEMSYQQIGALILWIIFAVACTIGFIVYFNRFRAEKAGDISDSFFGYRVIIPIIGCAAIITWGLDTLLLISVAILMMAVAYFIYRRSFRIKPADIAVLCFAVIVGLVSEI